MSETQAESPEDNRPMTFRNRCAAGCGGEHSPAGKAGSVMVPDIGLICADCICVGAAEFIESYPQKHKPLPSYDKEKEA